MDTGMSQALTLSDSINKTLDSIDWDAQFNYLNTMKDSLLKKSSELLSEFNELMKQVKNNLSDFEVIVPFDESIGEKFNCSVEDGKLKIEVTFKNETSERCNKTTVIIPQNCDVEKMEQKYNSVTKTMTVIIPKVIVEKEEKKEEEAKPHGYKVSHTPKKKPAKVETEEAHQATSKLLKKFKEANAVRRAPNGRFVKRTPEE